MREVILTYQLGRQSWGDPSVVLWVYDRTTLPERRIGAKDKLFSFKGYTKKTPFELLEDIVRELREKTKDDPRSRTGTLPTDPQVEQNPERQYGAGIEYGSEAFWPSDEETEANKAKRATEIGIRNRTIHERLYPVFETFAKNNGLSPIST